MIVKTQTILSLATLLIIFSCNRNQEQSPLSFALKVVKAHGYVVPKDSMAEPIEIPAGKPTVVRVGKPKVVLTNANVHPADTSKVVIAGLPKVCTPGQDSFSLPKTVPAIDSSFVAGIPEVEIAKEAYTKDQNPQNFTSFGRLQGLRNAIIHSLLEDKSGNLWIATESGVTRYDGKSFTHFTAKEGLSNIVIQSMFLDTRGNLWFGNGTSGVDKYDGKNFTHFSEKEGLSNNWVSSILEDKSGNLWFGTQGGVSMYDGVSFTHFAEKEGLINNRVSSIEEDKSGNLWFGTGGGVSRYDGKSFTNFTEKEGLNSSNVNCILKDTNGKLWFGTSGGGVSRYDGRSFTHFTVKEGLSNNWVFSIKEDNSGNLWFGTGGGVSKFDGSSFTHFTEKEGLSNNEVKSILEDKRGNLWFGTSGGGVNKYGGKRFTHFTVKEGLTDSRVVSILEDKGGNLWIGTEFGGVSRYNGKSFTNFTSKGFRLVWFMMEDKIGNLWFASFWGIGKYDGESFTHIGGKEIDGIEMDVKCMLEDKSSNLWFGTFRDGVVKYDSKRKSFTWFTVKEGLCDNYVRSIVEDKNGHLWFGTLGGLSRYDGKSFTNFSVKEGLSDNKVLALRVDQSGNLWIGTQNGGVSKYDGANFTHFTEKEGLSKNNVRSIFEDKSGNLWFGTSFGLTKLEKAKLASATKSREDKSTLTKNMADETASGLSEPELLFKTYTYEDGFAGIGVVHGRSLCEAKDGTIWIATGDRLTAFHLAEAPDTIPPDVQLTGLTLFNEDMIWQNLEEKTDTSMILGNGVKVHDFHFDGVSKWYGMPEHLSLAYNNNYLAFQYLGIITQSPKKVKYKYKLEGLDKNWSSLTNRTEAPYSNLPHGKYTFKVKAMNGDGYWSKEFNYSFIIRPPWWHTGWAYTLYALLFAGFIYALFRYRLNKIRIQNEKEQKTIELELQALRAQMNPHFIFNSLNSINMFILENNKLQASEYLSKFSRLVRLILNNSQESFIPLDKELEALSLYLELEELRFEQKFKYTVTVDDSVDTTILKVPPLIIQPYAENAIWHGLMPKKDTGHLDIAIYQQEEILFCKITDDGIGRKKAAEFKSKSPSTRKSVGMRITSDRISILQKQGQDNSYISVSDLVLPDGSAGGTEVLLKIPTRND